MRRRIAIALLCTIWSIPACAKRPPRPSRDERRFTDMTGRTVSIPVTVKKTFSTSPMGSTLSYTFDPELLLGWNYELSEVDAPFIAEKYRSLPVLGGWFGKTAGANVEMLLRNKPDVILDVVFRQDGFTNDHAALLGEKTGVPVAFFTLGGIEDSPKVYEAMGALTGNPSRASLLSAYAKRLLERARSIAARVPPAERVRVYYAEGLKGLNTEPRGSMHAELIEYCGGSNVAMIEENNVTGYGNSPVSLEQVVSWNPDVILISDYLGKDGGLTGWRKVLDENPLWRTVKAVQNRKVFVVPRSPFQWIDRPPSVNRLAGAIWLPTIFYPHLCDYDPKVEIRDFYATFYRQALSEEAVSGLLDTALHP